MTPHTPEPWKIQFQDYGDEHWFGGTDEGQFQILPETGISDGYEIAVGYLGQVTDPEGLAVRKANAARIVACVNGCASLNPAAYRECVEALKSAEYVVKDWLKMKEAEHGSGWRGDRKSVLDSVQQALTAAEGRG